MDYFYFTMVFLVPLMLLNAGLFLVTTIMLLAPNDHELFPSRTVALANGISIITVAWLTAAMLVCLEVLA